MTPFEMSQDYQQILHFHCPRYSELPDLDLYMEQVLSIIEGHLSLFAVPGEKYLTSSMVNNYVKQKVVSPPKQKRYTRHHVAYLIVVCTLKPILSLSEICTLIDMHKAAYPFTQAYDYYCQALERALQSAFLGTEFQLPDTEAPQSPEVRLLRASVLSFANKIYLQKQLEWLRASGETDEKTPKDNQ